MSRDLPLAFPLWENQPLVLYHGTTESQARLIHAGAVNVGFGNADKDFGQGFYTTTSRQQAIRRAIYLQGNGTRNHDKPYLVKLTLNRLELARMNVLAFVRAEPDAEDLWSFVRHCRREEPFHFRASRPAPDRYDVVYGPLVRSWQSRTCYPQSDQISFHTARAQSLLNDAQSEKIIEPV